MFLKLKEFGGISFRPGVFVNPSMMLGFVFEAGPG